jgi:hypothetical protein
MGSSGCHACRRRAARHVTRAVAPPAFAGFPFPPEVITLAVRWYLRFGLSCRDGDELLAERGVEVDHVSTLRWVQRVTPLPAKAAPVRHRVGDRWWIDETYVKVAGRWRYDLPGNRPVRAGHRRVCVPAARCWCGTVFLHVCAVHHQSHPDGGHDRQGGGVLARS